MAVLTIDIGTTNCKVGLVSEDGKMLQLLRAPMQKAQIERGEVVEYDPEKLWSIYSALIESVIRSAKAPVDSIAITGMAEACLLVDPATSLPLTPILRWADTRPMELFQSWQPQIDQKNRFLKTGLTNHVKWGCYKLLYLLEQYDLKKRRVLYLSVPDYLVYRLCSMAVTDPSLAARTYLYDIHSRSWDYQFIEEVGLGDVEFPSLIASGSKLDNPTNSLSKNLPTALCGHDHLCASYALEAVQDTNLINSLGTAETLSGSLGQRNLTLQNFESGFLFGRKIKSEDLFWLGSIAASGSALNWAKKVFALEHEPVINQAKASGICFFPYLNGSNPPHAKNDIQALFLGLRSSHTADDMLQSVYEGVCYEMRWIYEQAAKSFSLPDQRIVVSCGGNTDRALLQLKANITGKPLLIPTMDEATMLGCAAVAGVSLKQQNDSDLIEPDMQMHAIYDALFNEQYAPMITLMNEQRSMRNV